MNNKLPDMQTSIETIQAKPEAIDMVEGLIKRNMELEEIFQMIQPLLAQLSINLYKDDNSPVDLFKLIADSIEYLKEKTE
jgi:hypothetical protein